MFSSITKGRFRRPAEANDTFVQTISEHRPQVYVTKRDSVTPFQVAEMTKPPAEPTLAHVETLQNHSTSGKTSRIISVGGGKGGIGKSFVSASIAINLAQRGFKVALVDLDLGAANLHTCLGIPHPATGLFDFVSGKVDRLEDVGVSGGVNGLTLFGGGQEFWQQVKPHPSQKIKLITKLQKLPFDYVLLDLGAGTHTNTLDFFIFSHSGILVVVPEPTSIENAYVFLKSVLFRKLQSIAKAVNREDVAEILLASLGDPKNTMPPLIQIQNFAKTYPEFGQKLLEITQMTQLGIIMNQVRTPTDIEIGTSMAHISKNYFGFSPEFLGPIRYDDAVWKSIRKRQPVHIEEPMSAVVADIQNVSAQLCLKFAPIEDNRMTG